MEQNTKKITAMASPTPEEVWESLSNDQKHDLRTQYWAAIFSGMPERINEALMMRQFFGTNRLHVRP